MTKIITKDGREENFNSKNVEDDLKKAGLTERIAKEVAEQVETRVQDGWTNERVKQETDVELRRSREDIDRAQSNYKSESSMAPYNVGEQRTTKEDDYSPNIKPRSETKVECRNVEA